MGIKQDIIQELVQQLADTFEEVRAQGAEHPRRGLRTLDEALADAFRARPETLHMQLDHGIEEIDERLAAEVGRLLRLRAEVAEHMERDELAETSRRFAFRGLLRGSRKALNADTIDPDAVGEEGFAEILTAADVLADFLRERRTAEVIPPDEMAEAWTTLFEIEARRQRFPKAEDYLFHALDLAEDRQPVLSKGLRFFRRLQKLPDDVLTRRDLPRDEVEATLAELEAMEE